jgi:class 3 adenylate cyclase
LQSNDISLNQSFVQKLRTIPLNDPTLVPALFERSQIDKKAFFKIATPLTVEDGVFQKALITWINPAAFKEAFSQAGVFEKFLFLGTGEILVRSVISSQDPNRVPVESYWDKSFLKQIPQPDSKLSNAQIQLANAQNRWSFDGFIGHSYKSRIPNLYVSVLSSESSLLETILAVARRSAYLGLAILCLSLVIGVIFADSVVKPLLSLVNVANSISEGKFDIHLKPQSRDEIATLTNAFNHMAQGLAERERIKEVFGKFHSKAVFQKLLVEDRIRLGGERVPVTVFFSDIRSFTNTSESMAPEQVVEFLNEYMSEMVAVIEKHGGVVDKYVGDAIMAIWGLPEANPSVDAQNAVRACLEMRERLVLLNERRKLRGQNPIQIGMGLNSGEVVAGNIGSPSRMEYTVIGDTVNTASRMESLTKEMGTDFLINESTVALLPQKENFSFEGPFETKVKGKADKVLVYGCTSEIFIAHFNPPPNPKAA